MIPIVRKDFWMLCIEANLTFLIAQFKAQENRDSKREKMATNYYKKIIQTLYADYFGILELFKRISAYR